MSDVTYCRICEAACGLTAERDRAGRVHRLRPDKGHPTSQGFVCAKGTRFVEVAHAKDRLTHPMRREADGSLHAQTWRQALGEVGGKLRRILREHGPNAVGFYFGNPLTFNALGAAAALGFARRLGTRNVFASGSQDCNNKFAGSALMHGSPLIHPIPDLGRADLAVMFGTNPAVSQCSFVHLEGGAGAFDRFVERGGEVVWVDPRRTESAERWGEHLAIRPGTDVFLMLALLHGLRGRYGDGERGQVEGLDRLLALASAYPPRRAATLTGLDEATIDRLLDRISDGRRVVFHMSVGVNMSGLGLIAYLALHALAWLTGNLDAPGGLLFHPLGPPIAELAKRLGGPGGLVRSRIGDFPAVLGTLPGGVLADEIETSGADRLRALVVVAGDPLKTVPGARRLRRALTKLDVIVSVDLFENETGRLAHHLLPTTSWLERWDLATTTLLFQQAGLLQMAGPLEPPPGSARPEWRIVADLSLAVRRPLLGSALLTRLARRLPVDRLLHRLQQTLSRSPYGLRVPSPKPGRYLGRGPRTPGHRLRFWSPDLDGEPERLAERAAAIQREEWGGGRSGGGGYLLIGRRRRIGHNSWLHRGARRTPREEAWMATSDLESLGVGEAGTIRISSRLDGDGAEPIVVPVRAREGLQPGTVVVPHGLPGVNVNDAIPSGVDMVEPYSGQHWMSAIPVSVEAV